MFKNLQLVRNIVAERSRAVCLLLKQNGWLFAPGAVFFLTGIALIVAPKSRLAVGVIFFIFVGVLLTYAAWRLLSIKRKLEALAKNLEAKISIQTHQARPPLNDPEAMHDEQGQDHKKIIFH